MRSLPLTFMLAAIFLVPACSGSGGQAVDDAGTGHDDAGTGPSDAGPSDAGPADAGPRDSGIPPTLMQLSPSPALPGARVTITGMRFDDATPSNNAVLFGANAATVESASATELVVLVPAGSGSGIEVTVTVAGLMSNTLTFDYRTDVLFVDADASGAGDGTSWTDAYADLATALASATPEQELWVAEGTYRPDASNPGDESLSFVLRTDIAIYGGFAGNEAIREDRDPRAHETILSGEIGEAGPGDNSDHVVVADDVTGARIDGFTIRDGDVGDAAAEGAGMLVTNASVHIERCLFVNNRISHGTSTAAGSGGALALRTTAGNVVHIVRSVFANNATTSNRQDPGAGIAGGGGAIVASGAGEMRIRNTLFVGNTTRFELDAIGVIGGGAGGAILVNGADTNDLRITHCTFFGNSALQGGALAVVSAVPNFFPPLGNGGDHLIDVTNSLFWGNTVLRNPPFVTDGIGVGSQVFVNGDVSVAPFEGGTGRVRVFNSVVQDLTSTGVATDFNVLTAAGTFEGVSVNENDPLLPNGGADPDGADDIWGTEDDEVRPQTGGPVTDAASAETPPVEIDVVGNARPLGAGNDIGAYEVE